MKILITGASGIIGRVLMHGLSKNYTVIGVDVVPFENVQVIDICTQEEQIKKLLTGVDVVVHLAWNIKEGGSNIIKSIPENKYMAERMYALALEQKVKKFILASSVHVSFGYIGYRTPGIVEDHQILHKTNIDSKDESFPLGTYGASKIYLETLGKIYSQKGLEVISVRFGNVTPLDSYGEYPFWLSHRDCIQFITCCIEAKKLPPYTQFFAISNNPCNPFDLSEAEKCIGYVSQDSSTCPLSI